jgi:hypothetical protein
MSRGGRGDEKENPPRGAISRSAEDLTCPTGSKAAFERKAQFSGLSSVPLDRDGAEIEAADPCKRPKRLAYRRNRKGAPYIYLSGVKYRPQPDYDNFVLANCIQMRKPQPSRRKGHIVK